MESKKLKNLFNNLALQNGFLRKETIWIKQFPTSLVSLDLQKSLYSNFHYVNIKSCIQNIFDKHFSLDDDSVKNYYGPSYFRAPREYDPIFDLESHMTDEEREQQLCLFFDTFLKNFVSKISTANGLLDYSKTSGKCFTQEFKTELERVAKPSRLTIDQNWH